MAVEDRESFVGPAPLFRVSTMSVTGVVTELSPSPYTRQIITIKLRAVNEDSPCLTYETYYTVDERYGWEVKECIAFIF